MKPASLLLAGMLISPASAAACTVPPIWWQPPAAGAIWCGMFYDRTNCRYGCLPETVRRLRRQLALWKREML